MSIQFDRLRLLENFDKDSFQERIVKYLTDHAKADPDAARMLAKAVTSGIINVDKAVEIVKTTTGLGEMSAAAGAGGYNPSLHATKQQYMGPELEENEAVDVNSYDDYKIEGKNGNYAFIGMSGNEYVFKHPSSGTVRVGKNDVNDKVTKVELEEDAPMLAHGKANISTYTNDGFKKTKRGTSGMKGVIPKDLWNEDYTPEDQIAAADSEIKLEEARNYHQFKREAATRTKAQQMHEAAKMINNKLDEINRLLEYTNQMRNDLSEGEEQLEYKHNTKVLFQKMNKKVVEAYTKLKKVK